MDYIQKRITKYTNEKEESIRLSSIRRDAALFTAARLGTFKQASEKNFTDELTYWLNYFSTEIYKSPEALKKEAEKKMRTKEIKDPLNHIDADMPIDPTTSAQ